ncbi:GNAT family N-acetyltransferase [Lujinxingia litoralis]|nr:GNAT family N-acetyltransferase [Lujinxingia litoralis]
MTDNTTVLSSENPTTIEIPPNSQPLTAVKRLWRMNSATLGFFPDGAFNEYAKRGQILGVVLKEKCVGYLLYAKSREYARITHLCVHPDNRGQGIPEILFKALKQRVEHLESVRLTCRKDFDSANNLWRRLGLTIVGEKPARAEGKTLQIWKRELAGLPLLNYLDEMSGRDKQRVVIDANIFIALAKEQISDCDAREMMDAIALDADWLSELITLHITPEIRREISRQNDIGTQRNRKLALRRFVECNGDATLFESAKHKIRSLYPNKINKRDESDINHIAYSVAGNADYFVTNDAGILKQQKKVDKLFGLAILTPAELVTIIHEAEHRHYYHPARLAGTMTKIRRVNVSNIQETQERFLSYTQGERSSDFRQKLDKVLLSPDKNTAHIVTDRSTPLALWTECISGTRLDVPILRVSRGSLKTTLAFHLVWHLTRTAVENGATVLTVTDDYLDPELTQALLRYDFFRHESCWKRIIVHGIHSPDELIRKIEAHHDTPPFNAKSLLTAKTPDATAKLEKAIWPAKVINSSIASYIVAIKPWWAMQLFDKQLAESDLFGAKPELMLNGENVYYRSAHPQILSAPSRILWYITSDPKKPDTKSIRACSQIVEIKRGSASDLYKKFKHLGVYTWEDVKNIANGDPQAKITAFRFTLTELFEQPVPWNDFQSILLQTKGKPHTLQCPVNISESAFLKIYRRGMVIQ